MTDRNAGYLVVLSEDVREDDAERWTDAIRMIKGVVSVTPVPANVAQAIARERRDGEWVDALLKLARNGPAE